MDSPYPLVDAPWTVEGSAVVNALASDQNLGLTADEAVERLARHGGNELTKRADRPAWRLLLEQCSNAMVIVLLVAAAITAVIGSLKDTLIIVAIVVLDVIVGFVQEYRAEQALDALKRMTSPSARVIRQGATLAVPSADVVPGDLLRLEAGDVIAADARLLDVHALRVDEAALTGESEPAEKLATALPDRGGTVLADRRNIAFSGTSVVFGRATAIVFATGMDTALGRVAGLLDEHRDGATPLQLQLSRLGKAIALLAGVVCVAVFASGVARGGSPEEMFLVAVSLAVAAIPEGLPAVVTIALAFGARRMARRSALVRKLPAVETLGSVSVICTDKTGTLTENRMSVERVWTPAGTVVVSGDGYAPEGTFAELDKAPGEAIDRGLDEALDRVACVAAACNDAVLHAPGRVGGQWSISGDPTEGALLAFAGKRGVFAPELRAALPRVEELTFDASRRLMTTMHDDGDRVWVAAKGALEAIAPILGQTTPRIMVEAERVAGDLAAGGYRVLALAEREIDGIPDDIGRVERDLRLVGLVAMTDPPRTGAVASIAACRAAGIAPVMVTGDHPLTAIAIARRLGILRERDEVLTGAELSELDDDEFAGRVERVSVFARMDPEQKLRIVAAWRGRGAVVAMTGDGVNDAPALRLADIGVAMGQTGTDVSKEAADIVLADDDFTTIVAAVEEGRRIYDNIRRFVRYLLTTNSAEVMVMFIAPFLGLPVPLLAVQILWVNLVTDGPPALALGVEAVERDAMRRRPRPRGESILGRGLWQSAIWLGMIMAAVVLAVQGLAIAMGWHWQTMVFTTLALLQLGNALAVRSEHESVFRLGLTSNRPLTVALAVTIAIQLALIYVPAFQPVFSTQALSAPELAVVLVASTTAFVAVELHKALRRRRQRG